MSLSIVEKGIKFEYRFAHTYLTIRVAEFYLLPIDLIHDQ
jgi:hypothetical protein